MTVFLSSPVLPVPLSRSVCVSVGRLPAWLSHLCRSVLVFLSLIVCLFATDRQTDRLTQTPTHRHTDRQTDSKHRQKAYVRTDVYTQAVLTVSSEHTIRKHESNYLWMSALPFFQCRTGNHCGMHAPNMHAGHDKFSKESMVVAAEALRDKYTTNGVAYEPRSTSLRMVIIVRNFFMHAGDLECVTGRSSSTPESRSSSVSKHIISLRSLRPRTVSCATHNRRAPSLSEWRG
jgi:hypothetical protein